ncbi:unnamed protein product [Rotaria magnacalcarata]|uniref:Uncharacterized protein n=1 Tax=Rotaria magnacalcarata TaxID=392030 RepID=A0A8S2R2S9_9BILA|nr:unnamed protein product [Rotaria magnacalcarata]
MASTERRGHERSASAEFNRVDRAVQIQNATERLRSEMLNYVTNRFEEFTSEIKKAAKMPLINEIVPPNELASISKVTNEKISQTIASQQSVDVKRSSSAFPTKVFRMRSSILTELLEVSHIRSIRQIFISILVLLVLQVAMTDLFETGSYVD